MKTRPGIYPSLVDGACDGRKATCDYAVEQLKMLGLTHEAEKLAEVFKVYIPERHVRDVAADCAKKVAAVERFAAEVGLHDDWRKLAFTCIVHLTAVENRAARMIQGQSHKNPEG